jgi:hypothetical protein
LVAKRSKAFVDGLRGYAREHGVPLVEFSKGQRKDDVMHEHLARCDGTEQVLFIGRAQEKARVFRTERRRNPTTGVAYPWVVSATAMVNQFYVYAVDEDFGPFFIKFSSYFPYTGRLCINGNEYAKRQTAKAGIAFSALDNGFATIDDPTDDSGRPCSAARAPRALNAALVWRSQSCSGPGSASRSRKSPSSPGSIPPASRAAAEATSARQSCADTAVAQPAVGGRDAGRCVSTPPLWQPVRPSRRGWRVHPAPGDPEGDEVGSALRRAGRATLPGSGSYPAGSRP